MRALVKTINQSTDAECGLACIAMIADAHGKSIGLAELRRRHPLSLKGARLSDLIRIAQQIGLSTRPLRLDLDDLGKLRLPCVLHWDLNHFVVLKAIKGAKAIVVDPARGERTMSQGELSRHFTGVALELTPTADFTPEKPAPHVSIRQLTGPLHGLRNALGQILLLSGALQLFLLIAPFFMQWVVDQVLVSSDNDLLTVLAIGFGAALLLQAGVGQLRGWAVIHLSAQLGVQWRANVFAHLMRLPMPFFESRHLGDVTSRLGSIHVIQRTLTTSFVEAVIDGLMSVVTLSLMMFYSWKLALVTVIAVLLYLAVRWLAYTAYRDRTERHLMSAARQETHLLESLRGMQSLKIAGEEPRRRSSYENLVQDSANQEVHLAHFGQAFATFHQALFGLERILVIWIGANLALQNIFSVGMLVAYLAYREQFSMRVGSLVDKWIEFRMLRLHGERLADIVHSEPEDPGVDELFALDLHGGIEVRGLCFRYAEGEPWVLKDCSFRMSQGESVAIIGESGSGKTTLVKLLTGLLRPCEGTVLFSGIDSCRLGLRNVRSMVGAVMQDDQLFAGSIAENISFFDTGFDLERIERAATIAAIHSDITAMPMGYQTLIGDMGSSLSGGQKQRVVLARALYREPKLLVLDEATSHLDVMKERLVNDAVSRLPLTRIIIAHRPETIASADRVLVMERGRIVHEFRPQAAVSSSPTD